MAYLTSSATLNEIRAAYRDNCTYDLDASTEKCRYFIQAVRFLIELSKNETRQGSSALREETAKYEKERDAAIEWLQSRDATFAGAATGGVTFADLSGIRG